MRTNNWSIFAMQLIYPDNFETWLYRVCNTHVHTICIMYTLYKLLLCY